jgi:hypothetical protein
MLFWKVLVADKRRIAKHSAKGSLRPIIAKPGEEVAVDDRRAWAAPDGCFLSLIGVQLDGCDAPAASQVPSGRDDDLTIPGTRL